MKKNVFKKSEDVSTERNLVYNLPLVNAKHGNNGIMYFGKESDFDSAEMSIDIVNDGAIATGDVYPQPQKTGVLYNAYLIKFSNTQQKITKNHLFYFASAIEKSIKKRYSYDNKAGWEKVQEEQIALPTSKNRDIDFTYIENFIADLQQQQYEQLEDFLKTNGLDNCILTLKEKNAIEDLKNNKIPFKNFAIKNLFSIATGRDIIINKTDIGPIPLISHQHENNGISKEIKQLKNRRLFNHQDTLALADRGVFGATTQNKNFHIGTRVKAITFLDGVKSENIRLFFVTAINKLQILFKDYLTNATDSLPNLEICLPITMDGNIDYDFMENFVSAQKKLIAKKLICWLEQQNINENILKIENSVSNFTLLEAADKNISHEYIKNSIKIQPQNK